MRLESISRLSALAMIWTFVAAIACGDDIAKRDAARLRVHTDFAGGSGEILSIDHPSRTIRLNPSHHKGRGWVCWWYVRVTGITPGETVTLDVGEGRWATPDRAAFSTDGVNWSQTEPGQRAKSRIAYRQKLNADEAWFAWGPPFVPDDSAKLCRWAAENCDAATKFQLCRSREDRPVPALRIVGNEREIARASGRRNGVWIIARQHAWECGSSWVCRGLVEWLVSDDAGAVALRKKSDVTIVPIMDIDNVAIGAGGKEQEPQDHNRDWSDRPYYPAVAAAQQAIKKLDDERRFDLFIDLHNPGPNDTSPFFYIAPRSLCSDGRWHKVNQFLDAARKEMTGPLRFHGATKESGPSYDRDWERIGKNWVTSHTADRVVALTLETPWNTRASTTDGYRQVGRELGLAIERYLHIDPRDKDDKTAE